MRKVNEKGLTLIEALITLAIGTVVAFALLVIMVNTGGLFYRESSKVTQGLNINDGLSKIETSIKESSGVSTSFTSLGTTYTSSTTTLVLKVPSQDSTGSIIPNVFDYFIFFQDTNKLRFKIFPDSQSSIKSMDQIFSTKVSSLLFQYFDSQNPSQEALPQSAVKIKVTLQLQQKAGATYETNTATVEANLRND